MANCVQLVLSTATASCESHNVRAEGCKCVWLLDGNHQKLGTVWYISTLDAYNNKEVNVILLSKIRSSFEADN